MDKNGGIMLNLILFSLAAVAAAGLALKFYLEHYEQTGRYRITRLEFIVEMVLMALVVSPLTAEIGIYAARSNLLTFNEYLNGWESEAARADTACYRDSACRHNYDCDPYPVPVSYSCGEKNEDTCWTVEIRYHSCPYVTVESDYAIRTTVGNYSIATNRFPDNPNQHRWRTGKNIPDYVIQNAGAGIPDFWLAAKRRIDSGRPGPATTRSSYVNYIYASDITNLKQYSPDVKQFLDMKLLPRLASTIHDFYRADKAHFIGYLPEDARDWQQSLEYLTAALGSELQGDLQFVITRNDAINANPDRYVNSVKAYWQDKEVFDRDTFSKNGIGIVVGTQDGKTIAWARAFTGMPLGNEQLLVALNNNLKGVLITPENVFGAVRGQFREGTSVNGKKLTVVSDRNGGVLAQLLWGQPDRATKFARVSMTANDPTDNGSGFLYLSSEIQPTTGQSVVIIIVIFFLGLAAWAGCAAFDGDEIFRQLLMHFNLKTKQKGT
ncbi:hypothetical protein K8R03_00015 [Candidatus Kaiserbacteria bacterium]|nr:hypothetical protein [Candidatus Kaiserbacteria bacterium]